MCERRPMTREPKQFSGPLLAAGLLGLSGVALGALGAHAMKAMLLERGMTQAWETAARYHMFHAIAVLAAAVWLRVEPANGGSRDVCVATRAVRCWTAGVVLFSGSLYGLALGGPRWLGPVTPIGGLVLMAGWICVAVAAFRRKHNAPP
jgi:uncharacterized membrane protein YgdD (TMEM256/DUF423 family)